MTAQSVNPQLELLLLQRQRVDEADAALANLTRVAVSLGFFVTVELNQPLAVIPGVLLATIWLIRSQLFRVLTARLDEGISRIARALSDAATAQIVEDEYIRTRASIVLVPWTYLGYLLRFESLAWLVLAGFTCVYSFYTTYLESDYGKFRRAVSTNNDPLVFVGLNLRGKTIEGARDVGMVGESLVFEKTDLVNAKFVSACTGWRLEHCNLFGASLEGATWDGAQFRGCNMTKAKAANAKFANASFLRCELVSADLANADLRFVIFESTDLRGAKLDGAHVAGTDFRTAIGLLPEQIVKTRDWNSALFDDDLRKKIISHIGQEMKEQQNGGLD